MGIQSLRRGFENLLDEFGETVILKTISRSENDYGDLVETTSSETSVEALVTEVSELGEHEKFGDLLNADTVCSVKYNVSVNKGDMVVIDSEEYSVTGITEVRSKGSVVYKELKLKRKE